MRKFRISINESATDSTIFERYVFAATLDNACMNAKNLVGAGRWAHVVDAELIDVWAIVDEGGSYDASEHLHYGVDRINRAYDRLCDAIAIDDEKAADDFADLYEFYLEKFANAYGMSEARLEDIATDVRFVGWERD